jgi:hypothetical protein
LGRLSQIWAMPRIDFGVALRQRATFEPIRVCAICLNRTRVYEKVV